MIASVLVGMLSKHSQLVGASVDALCYLSYNIRFSLIKSHRLLRDVT